MDFQFRTVINKENTEAFADRIDVNFPDFNKKEFIEFIHERIEELSYGGRIKLVREALERFLPDDYEKNIPRLLKSLTPELGTPELSGFEGFINLPVGAYVAKNGMEHFELSMNALYELTKRFSSESDIRPFIEKYPKESLKIIETWAYDKNVHVRRLVSEGTRPRLPLGTRLQMFIKNPKPIIRLLNILKNDPELYVRRSVANSLNDISKDNPDIVVETLRKWNKKIKSPNMEWLTKHALRTLIKRGHPGALQLIGVAHGALVEISDIALSPTQVKIGSSMIFDFEVKSRTEKVQPLVIDYEVHYVKANGSLQAKTFKICKKELHNTSLRISKKHSFKEMTTRKHYPGMHLLKIKINGKIYGEASFELTSQ